MQLKTHIYEDTYILNDYVDKEVLNTQFTSCLVQVFTGILDKKILFPILEQLKKKIPNVEIVGSSTADGIVDDDIYKNKIIISFSLFEKTSIKTYYEKDLEIASKKLCNNIINEDSKLVIVFNSGLINDIEPFLQNLKGNTKNALVVGGNAADNYEFKKTYIFNKTDIYEEGVVFAILDSKNLRVNNNYALNWLKIGKELTITKSFKNRVYEIDNMPVLDLYKKYFGEEIVDTLPSSVIEFPLVKVENSVDIARSLIKVEDDNSFVYAGYLNVGDKVKFAIGNIEDIYANSISLQNQLLDNPVEGIYIYSCSVRNMFLKEQLKVELKAISDVASSVGFFTYGEFFQKEDEFSQLNISTTLVCLSEDESIKNENLEKHTIPQKSTTLRSLTNLINSIQNDLDENINFLKQYKDIIDRHAIVSKTDKKGNITYANDKFCQISGYTDKELLGKPHNIVRHPDFPRDSFKKLWKDIKEKKSFQGIIKNRAKNGQTYFVDTIIEPILDKNEKLIEYVGLRHDVTAIMNQKIQLKDDLKNMDRPFLALVKIEDYKIIKDFYEEDILHQIEDRFSLEVLNYLPQNAGYKKVYCLEEGKYAFVKDLEDDCENALKKEINILKELQINVKNATINFENFEFDINIIISISNDRQNTYIESKLGLEELIKTNQNFIYAQGLSKKLNKIAVNNIQTIKMIKEAISNQKIVSYYQAIYNNKTDQIEKYESLVRLIDEHEKVISPYFFLETSKKGRYYKQITKVVINNSFEALKLLNKDITINISTLDIEDDFIRNLILEKLSLCKECTNKITLELLEDESIKDFALVKDFIKEVKAKGALIAIDDFGSGYSNFERLLEFEPDILKIDGSLIKNILTDNYSKDIVETIILFAKKQNIKVVAEFVSSKDIFDMVSSLGIDYSQGYFIDKPKDLSELKD